MHYIRLQYDKTTSQPSKCSSKGNGKWPSKNHETKTSSRTVNNCCNLPRCIQPNISGCFRFTSRHIHLCFYMPKSTFQDGLSSSRSFAELQTRLPLPPVICLTCSAVTQLNGVIRLWPLCIIRLSLIVPLNDNYFYPIPKLTSRLWSAYKNVTQSTEWLRRDLRTNVCCKCIKQIWLEFSKSQFSINSAALWGSGQPATFLASRTTLRVCRMVLEFQSLHKWNSICSIRISTCQLKSGTVGSTNRLPSKLNSLEERCRE